MRILIFHGYLLRGTGSNIYNANLARALADLGHEVHLLCQDRHAGDLEWVDAIGDWSQAELEVRSTGRRVAGPDPGGSVTVYRPAIGELLPVYVEDPYEGFEARAFPRLSDREIEHYIEVNVGAVGDVIRRAGPPGAALANHLIMGPAVLARAGVRPYAVKNHGSDLEYTIKPNPRFIPWAREGLEPAASVLVGSLHTATSLWEAVPEPDLKKKTGLGPPGVDTDRFSPLPAGGPPDGGHSGGGPDHGGPSGGGSSGAGPSGPSADPRASAITGLAARIAAEPAGIPGAAFGREPGAAVTALGEFAAARGPRVIFIGKLIVSKGVDLLVAAWPIVCSANPGARLLLGGFGAYEAGLRALVGALGEGDLDLAQEIADTGRGLEGGEAGRLDYLAAFLADPPPGYRAMARAAAGSVLLTGRLEHDEVAAVLPAADAMVVPSTFPEAFGMVAAEAAASGVLPICARHSGLAEVTAVLAAEVPAVSGSIEFDLGSGAVSGLADRINGWLGVDPGRRAAIGREIADAADRYWSWEEVARDVISASDGQIRPLAGS